MFIRLFILYIERVLQSITNYVLYHEIPHYIGISSEVLCTLLKYSLSIMS